jgi:hypothetical protein
MNPKESVVEAGVAVGAEEAVEVLGTQRNGLVWSGPDKRGFGTVTVRGPIVTSIPSTWGFIPVRF